jgi:hypothetical protein
MENIEKIKNLFGIILNSNIEIKEDTSNIEKENFISLIKSLEDAYSLETNILDVSGIDLYNVTDPLWVIIEGFIQSYYGEKASKLIFWYIFNRFDLKGNVIPLMSINNETFIIDTPESVWEHLSLIAPEDIENTYQDELDELEDPEDDDL